MIIIFTGIDMRRDKLVLFSTFLSIIVLLSGVFPSVGCLNENKKVQAEEESEDKITGAEADKIAVLVDKNLVGSNTMFGFSILKELILEDNGQNVFISPMSILLALAMVYNGAVGETSLSMSDTLGFKGFELDELNSGFHDLIASIKNADSDVEISIANSIWYDLRDRVKEDFIERNSKYFNSEVNEIDFYAPGAVDTINGWIKEETGGKIDKMISKIPDDAVMYLINTIYFKGNWTYPFDESLTVDGDFHLSDGNTVKVPMMSRQEDFGYFRGDNFSGVKLYYGQEKIAMYVFLPEEGVEVDRLIESLDEEEWNKIRESFYTSSVSLVMPKYKLEYGIKLLNEALTNLGMGIAFVPGLADFSGIFYREPGDYSPWISLVLHKAVIEVNEKGSEAAAATVVEIAESAMPVEEVIKFVVDRPFFFVIADDRSGSILFMGKVVKP